jgi:hypothetical protein
MCRDTPTRRLGMSRPPDARARARDALVDLRARLDDATRGACLAAYWRAVRAACDDAQRMGAETFARGRKRVDDEAARAFGASRSAMATHATLMETLARAVRASAARAGAEAADEDDAGRRRGNEGETKTNEDARRRASDGGAVRRAIGSGFATVVTKKRSRRAERAGKASETRTALGAPLGESKASRDATGGALTAARLRARLAVVSRGMARGMRVRADVGKVLAAAARARARDVARRATARLEHARAVDGTRWTSSPSNRSVSKAHIAAVIREETGEVIV